MLMTQTEMLAQTAKMLKLNKEEPVSLDDTGKHESRILETEELASVYKEVLDTVLELTLADCVIVTPVLEESSRRYLLGEISDVSDAAKARLSDPRKFTIPKKFDSPVKDPINFIGHKFFPHGVTGALTAFGRSVRDKGYFSVQVPDAEENASIICCCITFDGPDCPAEEPGYPNKLVYHRLVNARFIAQLQVCRQVNSRLSRMFVESAEIYLDALRQLRVSRLERQGSYSVNEFKKSLRACLSALCVKQMAIQELSTPLDFKKQWDTDAAERGLVTFTEEKGEIVAKVLEEIGSKACEVTFSLFKHAKAMAQDITSQRLFTTFFHKVGCDLTIAGLDRYFDKTFIR